MILLRSCFAIIVKRFVVDTSVIISACLSPKGKPQQVLKYIAENGIILFTHDSFDEALTRLKRPKFDKWLALSFREDFLLNTLSFSEWVSITGTLRACRDPNDDMFLETALIGKADAIITGDKDLLVLNPFEDIPILTAAGFLEQFNT